MLKQHTFLLIIIMNEIRVFRIINININNSNSCIFLDIFMHVLNVFELIK